MEIKKSPKVDLQNYRSTFFLFGAVVALGLLYMALEWGSGGQQDPNKQRSIFEEISRELDMIPLMKEEPKVIPPQPKMEKPKVEEIKVANEQMEQPLNQEPEVKLEIPEFVPEVEERNDPLSSVEMTKEQADSVFRIVEQLPEYPGGMVEFMKWLTKNLKYPIAAQRQRIQGTCIVQFIVNKDGSISDAKIKKSVSRFCDAEALRVIRMMPNWKPGRMNGEIVRTQFVIPIEFKL